MITLVRRFGQLTCLLAVVFLMQNCTEDKLIQDANLETVEATALIDMEQASEMEYLEEAVLESRTRAYYTFNTLNQALSCTGLDAVLGEGKNTVYAPSDAAFEKLGLDRDNICEALDAETLSEILLYHVVPANIVRLWDRGCVEMANGDLAQISSQSYRLFLNESKIYRAFTLYGREYKLRVYAITDVLEVPTDNIVTTAAGADVFASLVDAVLAADPSIAAALSDEDAIYTVFAPTNQAFADLLAAFELNSLAELVDVIGVDALSQVLLYHVVDACAFSNNLEDGLRIGTLQGEELEIDLENLSILDKTEVAAGLEVDLLDIRTSNGVVHAINKVLLPQAVLDSL